MSQLPSGTVTFLFTDVEGSTRRWEQDSEATRGALERHFAILDQAIVASNGARFKTIGDAIQAAFATAPEAVHAAVAAQRGLNEEDWGRLGPIRVRMAIHTGAATPQAGDYLAPALNRLARLLSVGHAGQILVSESTALLVRDTLSSEIQLHDLGEHRLRDLREVERVFQVVAPGLPATFPPLKSLEPARLHLPSEATSFIGRESAVGQVRERLAAEGTRLLTLTGPGGTGKTRLALRAATELADSYPDGVWFVHLAPVAQPDLVPAAIASALGVRETPGESIEATLRGYLQPKEMLLVLDNFEHVIEAAPRIASLLANAPGLRVLATSRAPLRISGEQEFAVPPLDLPPDGGPISLEEVQLSEAVRLFVERARAVRPDFHLTADNVAAVVAICRRLDGLPLAIELAAARTRLLPPEAIVARLDSRLTLLTGGARDLPERQQTLRAAIAWSYDLLEPEEQALFRRLAVFAGGWTLEEAEAIGAAEPALAIPIIDGLEILGDNSLVRQLEDLRHTRAYDPRFTMLQTIRAFALEQLAESGEEEKVRAAHAAVFSQLAGDAGPHLTGRDSVLWLDRLDADHDNFRAALSWFQERNDARQAVAMAAALWRFWWLRGHFTEGRGQLDTLLALPTDGLDWRTRAVALDGAGVLAETQGDYARAEELHRNALALSREHNDAIGIARSLGNLGVIAFDRGDIEHAVTLLSESLVLAQDAADHQLIATALNDLGRVAHFRADYAQAEQHFRKSLGLRRQFAGESEIARSLHNLGVLALDRGDHAQARRLFEESLELQRAAGDTWGAAGAFSGLAEAMRGQGDLAGAVPLLEQSVRTFQEAGDARSTGWALLNLADIETVSGDRDQAPHHYREALSRFQGVEFRPGIIHSLAGLGRLLVREERYEGAAIALGAAVSLSEGGDPAAPRDPEFDAAIATARDALGALAFAAAWETGAQLSPLAAIDRALAVLDDDRLVGTTAAFARPTPG
jgi:predicted ATPase/class 3 adenylate cyclase/Tfp pilus assembly protein PilF